jgi:prepilin-type processing-associated H-X9-DG protein
MLGQYRDQPGSVTTGFYTSFSDCIDGTSSTLIVGERSNTHLPGINPVTMTAQANYWRSWVRGNNGGSGTTKNITYPINSTDYHSGNNFNDISMGSNHPGGAQFLLTDGSVAFLSENIDFPLYLALASRASKENAQVQP